MAKEDRIYMLIEEIKSILNGAKGDYDVNYIPYFKNYRATKNNPESKIYQMQQKFVKKLKTDISRIFDRYL